LNNDRLGASIRHHEHPDPRWVTWLSALSSWAGRRRVSPRPRGFSAGGWVSMTPLMSMVAQRGGLRVRRNRRSDRPVRACTSRPMARAVDTMVSGLPWGSRVRWWGGRPSRAWTSGMPFGCARTGCRADHEFRGLRLHP